jgi:hypothetical protein
MFQRKKHTKPPYNDEAMMLHIQQEGFTKNIPHLDEVLNQRVDDIG